MTGFSKTLRLRLDTKMRGKKFTAADFMDIADSSGIYKKEINDALRRFEVAGLITAVTLTPHPTGGSPRKTFVVTKGADFRVKNAGAKHCRREAMMREKSLKACLNKLDAVTAGWARA